MIESKAPEDIPLTAAEEKLLVLLKKANDILTAVTVEETAQGKIPLGDYKEIGVCQPLYSEESQKEADKVIKAPELPIVKTDTILKR